MIEIVLATRNKHKKQEIEHILKDFDVKIRNVDEFPDVEEVVEDKETLDENAIKKAKTVALKTQRYALADDSGLEVEALDGAPGVYSARYAGEDCSYQDNNKKLLEEMSNVPDEKRNANFRCVIAFSDPEGKVSTVEGNIKGKITTAIQGDKGFGYDPVFFIPGYNKTFAELTPEEKNKISHRARALEKAKIMIEDQLKQG